MSTLKENYPLKCKNWVIYDELKEKLFISREKIIFPDGHSAFFSKFLFSNSQFITLMNCIGNEMKKNTESFYVYNIYNRSLPIKEYCGTYFCPNKFENHPLCGVNWLVAKKIAEIFGSRLPWKSEMDYLTINISNQKEINTDEMLGETNRVDYFCKDKFGLYDICGNLAEWCEDYNPEYFSEKLVYGVSWNNAFGGNRMFYRYKWEQLGAVSVGFRLVWDETKKELSNLKK